MMKLKLCDATLINEQGEIVVSDERLRPYCPSIAKPDGTVVWYNKEIVVPMNSIYLILLPISFTVSIGPYGTRGYKTCRTQEAALAEFTKCVKKNYEPILVSLETGVVEVPYDTDAT